MAWGGKLAGEPVSHRDHLDQEKIHAGGIEVSRIWVGSIVGGKRRLERHCNDDGLDERKCLVSYGDRYLRSAIHRALGRQVAWRDI